MQNLQAKATVALVLAALTGCESDSARTAQAVSSAQHCGGQTVARDALVRLSKYSAGIPSDDIWVIELCHPERGCNAVATYQNGAAPISTLQNGELRIIVPMATRLQVIRDEAWIDGREVALRIKPLVIRTKAERDSARATLGLAPGSISYPACIRDLDPRPYYR